MRRKSFKRGFHPYDGKELSAACPIKEMPAEEIMVYPLLQHRGKPAKAIVGVGDRVLKGQMIAQADGFISAPVHSSVSGTVKAIEKRNVANGSKEDCIVVINDNEYETVDNYGIMRDLDELENQEIIDSIKNAGVVGMGGAGFPSYVKLTPKNADEIDTLIINGAECEPYLTSDYRLMLEKSDEIIKGVAAVLRLLPNAKAVIGIEDNKTDAAEYMIQAASNYKNIEVCMLKTKYPQGGERQLIYAVTGRKINSKMLPADKLCVVVNIASCYAIYEAVYKQVPLIHRVMTVTGQGIKSPCNVDVPLGVNHLGVLEFAGGESESTIKFISGGPMMGMAMPSLDVPVVKTSSSILAIENDDVANYAQSPCIHCGRCVSVCPQNLIVQMIGKSVKARDFDEFERVGGMECIECGCCSFVCPAKIPLTQMCRLGKSEVIAKRRK